MSLPTSVHDSTASANARHGANARHLTMPAVPCDPQLRLPLPLPLPLRSPAKSARPGCRSNPALDRAQYLTFAEATAIAATECFANRRPGMPGYVVTLAMVHRTLVMSLPGRPCPADELESRAAAVYVLDRGQAVEEVREGLEDLFRRVVRRESHEELLGKWGEALEMLAMVDEMEEVVANVEAMEVVDVK